MQGSSQFHWGALMGTAKHVMNNRNQSPDHLLDFALKEYTFFNKNLKFHILFDINPQLSNYFFTKNPNFLQHSKIFALHADNFKVN